MRRPIRTQILVPFTVTVVISVSVIAATAAWLAARQAENQTLRQIRSVASTLADSNLTFNAPVLRKMSGLSGAEFVALDENGAVVESTLHESDSKPIDWTASPAISPDSTLADFPAIETGAEVGRCFVARVKASGGARVETLIVLYPEASWRHARWTAVWPPLLFGAVTVVAMAVISAWLAERFARRVDTVRSLLGDIAAGEFPEAQSAQAGTRDTVPEDELDDLVLSARQLATQLQELQQTIQQTERIRLLAQLAGGFAHQLRNAVTGARMAVQLHKQRCLGGREVEGNSDSDETLDVALRQLSLTEEQVRGLLSLSRKECPPSRQSPVSEVVSDITALVTPQCEHSRVQLTVESDCPPDVCTTDAGGLRTALLNILLNALDAAGTDGRICLTVSNLRSAAQHGTGIADCATNQSSGTSHAISVEVSDSGAGPPAELTSSLFDPFVTSKPEGVGLGLALAARSVEAFGGKINWYRRHGQTVFQVDVPVLVTEEESMEVREPFVVGGSNES